VERRAVFVVTLTLLLMSILTSMLTVFSVQAVEIAGPIYIRGDGSIDPPTASILRNGNFYTLTDNIIITGSGIVVEKSRITLDGAGHTLQGKSASVGIFFYYGGNVVKNIEIREFGTGIHFAGGNNNTIIGNSITNNGIGIYIGWAFNNSIIGNSIVNNDIGVSITSGANNVLRNNSLTNSSLSVWADVFESHRYIYNDVDTSNTVNGKPVYWWVNRRDAVVPTDTGFVLLADCTNITVQNLNLVGNGAGIDLRRTVNSSISKNNVANGSRIILRYSSNNSISENHIASLTLSHSSNNSISRNRMTSLNLDYASYNNIFGNTLGAFLTSSLNNKFYHNNFLSKPYMQTPSPNAWDDGYPSGGNFWSSYTGIDADGDSIGDTPYVLEKNNQDRYPLITPAVWNYSSPIPIVWQGRTYQVVLSSNSTISTFKFRQSQRQISFNVAGTSDSTGYCNVTIPKQLLRAEGTQWQVLVDGVAVTPTVTEDANYAYLFFTYSHSTKTVEIRGTNAIGVTPELPSATILLPPTILAVFTALAAVLVERRFSRKLKTDIMG